MKHILFFVLTFSAAALACSSSKKARSSEITQGITGQITEATGNQMPMKDAPPRQPKGILTDVLVYEPTNLRQVARVGTSPVYTAIRTKLVASTTTDSSGHYTVALPVGSYSVFLKQGSGYYANLYDGNNNIAVFTVDSNKLTKANLTISLKASY
jgi:hypothetical protein